MANFFKNIGQIASNKFSSLTQNPDALKTESLILASLALVISRICIANVSAVKARGTSEGPYRYRESIRTDIREVCGWTFGFVVLRFIQNSMVKPVLRYALGITETADPNAYSLWTGIKGLFKGNVKKFTPQLDKGIETTWHGTTFSHALAEAAPVKWFIQKMYGAVDHAAKTDFMLKLYKMGSIALASIPTVALAGYALERFTRDHSDDVVDTVSGFLSKGAHKVQEGAGKVHAQVVHNPLVPFQGMPWPGRSAYAPFAQSGRFASPQFSAPMASLVNGSMMPPMQQPMMPMAATGSRAMAPQFAGRRPAIKPMSTYPTSRSGNRFAI